MKILAVILPLLIFLGGCVCNFDRNDDEVKPERVVKPIGNV